MSNQLRTDQGVALYHDQVVDPELTLSAREILFLMELKAGTSRKAHYSNADLVRITGYSLPTVKRAVRLLILRKYVVARLRVGLRLRPQPVPSAKVRYIWGHPGWVLHRALLPWEKHTLAYILSRRYKTHDDYYEVSVEGILDNCHVPGRLISERRLSVRELVSKIRKLGMAQPRTKADSNAPAVWEIPEKVLAALVPRDLEEELKGSLEHPQGVSRTPREGSHALPRKAGAGGVIRAPREGSSALPGGVIRTPGEGSSALPGGSSVTSGESTGMFPTSAQPEQPRMEPVEENDQQPGGEEVKRHKPLQRKTPLSPARRSTARTETKPRPVPTPPVTKVVPAPPVVEEVVAPKPVRRRAVIAGLTPTLQGEMFGSWTSESLRFIERKTGLGRSRSSDVHLLGKLHTLFPPGRGVLPKDIVKSVKHECWVIDDKCLAPYLSMPEFVTQVAEYAVRRLARERLGDPRKRFRMIWENWARYGEEQLTGEQPCDLGHSVASLFLARYGPEACTVRTLGIMVEVRLPVMTARHRADLYEDWLEHFTAGTPVPVPGCLGSFLGAAV